MKTNIDISKLWDTFTPKLYGYLMYILKDQALADDVLQNTWLKAIEALPGFEDRGFGFSAWLFAIAKNECRQYWRRSGKEIPFDEAVHDIKAVSNRQQEDTILVEQILAKVSKEDRELVSLRYIADLSLNDIAKVLKINPIAVRVRMHRAMNNLKQIVKNE
ncbi:MAG: RNA polymerase sigma factor [Patescibacteria group bacterium]